MNREPLHIVVFDYIKSSVSIYKTNLDKDAYAAEIEEYILTMGHNLNDIKYMVSFGPISVNNYFN